MSVEKIRALAAAVKDTYLWVPVTDLMAAIEEANAPDGPGTLREHVAAQLAKYKRQAGERRNPIVPGLKPPLIGVHRTIHLGVVTGEKPDGEG